VSAGVGEIDGTDKCDRDQDNHSGKKSEDDHCNLLKVLEREVQLGRQTYAV